MGVEAEFTPDPRDPEQLEKYKAGIFSRLRVKRGKEGYVPYTPHFGQMLIHFPTSAWPYDDPVTKKTYTHYPEAPWTYFVAPWGRRSGKTIGAAAEVVAELGLPSTQTWIVAPNYELTDRVFDYVYDWVVRQKVFGDGAVKKASRTKDNRYIEMVWGSWVKGKSADSPDSLVGEQLDLVIMDEAARIAEKIWTENLEPTTIDRKGRVIFISTPQGMNWFAKYYNRGKHPDKQRLGWRSVNFKTTHNPFIDSSWLEQKRYVTADDVWGQEYEGDFTVKAGLIFPDFKPRMYPDGHLYNPSDMEMDNHLTYYRGIDVGAVHPTACVWAAVNKDNDVYIFREYEESDVVHETHAEAIAALTAEDIAVSYISPDAARRSLLRNSSPEDRLCALDIYRRSGVYARKASDNWAAGVATVARYMRATMEDRAQHPKILISKECPKLIEALQTYSRAELSTSREIDAPDKPRKFNDHLPDALRYLLALKPSWRAFWMEEEVEDRPPVQDGFPSVPVYG